jgi:hypothetical protein
MRVPTLIQSGITHEINDIALLLKPSSIKISTFFDADEIRYLHRLEKLPRWRPATPGGTEASNRRSCSSDKGLIKPV